MKESLANVSGGQAFLCLHEKTVLDEGTYCVVRSSANCEVIHPSQDSVSPCRTESVVHEDSALS